MRRCGAPALRGLFGGCAQRSSQRGRPAYFGVSTPLRGTLLLADIDLLDPYRMAHKSNPWKKSTAKARPLALPAKQSSIPSGGERNSARISDVRKHRAVPLGTEVSACPTTLPLSRWEFGFGFYPGHCVQLLQPKSSVVLTLAAVGTLQMRWKWKKKRQRRLQRRRRKMRARSK